MIEVYSKNITVAQDQLIPFNIVALRKGVTVQNSGSYELVFNQCGIYELTVSATVAPVAAAATTTTTPASSGSSSSSSTTALAEDDSGVSIELIKDGVTVPQTQTEVSSTGPAAISFTTLVQVNRNNTPCVCSKPVICSIKNTGVETTFNNIDVVVTKIV